MEVTFNITRDDYWEYNKFFLKRRWLSPRGIVAGIVILALVSYSLARDDVPSFVLWVVLVLGVYWLFRRSVKRLPSETGSLLGEYYVRLDPEGMFGKTRAGEGLVRWSGVKDIAETPDYTFIFTDTHVAYIVPKRAFSNPSDARTFVDLAAS